MICALCKHEIKSPKGSIKLQAKKQKVNVHHKCARQVLGQILDELSVKDLRNR